MMMMIRSQREWGYSSFRFLPLVMKYFEMFYVLVIFVIVVGGGGGWW